MSFAGALRQGATLAVEGQPPAGDLSFLFRPRGVAVLGASSRELSIGYRVVRNLLDAGFTGGIYPVHPTEREVCGLPAFHSISDVPGPIDLVNVALRADRVPEALDACGLAGVRAAIIHSAGFAEVGPQGAVLESQALETARRHGMRLLGPNAQGLMNSDPDVRLYASFTFTPLVPGPVTILAHSGGVAELLNLHLRRAGVGIRWYASPGNSCDLDLSELLAAAATDEGTRVILMYIESVRDMPAFADAALRAGRDKALLVLKAGRTPDGARAVTSHTGALASGDVPFDAILNRAGALRMPTLREAVAAATAIARQPLPRGRRTALVCNAGGPGIAALDDACLSGLECATLTDATRASLRDSQSPFATIGALVDLAATAGPLEFGSALNTLLAADEVDGLVLSMVTPFFVDCDAVADAVALAAATSDKPVVVNVITDGRWSGVEDRLRSSGLPVFEFPEDASRAMAALTRVAEMRTRLPVSPPWERLDRSRLEAVLRASRINSDGWLSQGDAYAMLAAAGIPSAPIVVLRDDAQLSAFVETVARQLGFPVVVKADMPGLVHKLAAGAVLLNIADRASLVAAVTALRSRFGEAHMYAQRQVDGGIEAILGVVAQYPGLPLVMAGQGGTNVEKRGNVAFALAPLDDVAALRLIAGSRCPAFDDTAWDCEIQGEGAQLADALVRLSLLAVILPTVREIDINPLTVLPSGGGCIALDCRMRVS